MNEENRVAVVLDPARVDAASEQLTKMQNDLKMTRSAIGAACGQISTVDTRITAMQADIKSLHERLSRPWWKRILGR